MTAIAAEVKPKRTSGRSRWRAAGNVRRVRKLDRETRPTDSNNIFRWYRAGWGRYTQVDPLAPGGLGHFEAGRSSFKALNSELRESVNRSRLVRANRLRE